MDLSFETLDKEFEELTATAIKNVDQNMQLRLDNNSSFICDINKLKVAENLKIVANQMTGHMNDDGLIYRNKIYEAKSMKDVFIVFWLDYIELHDESLKLFQEMISVADEAKFEYLDANIVMITFTVKDVMVELK